MFHDFQILLSENMKFCLKHECMINLESYATMVIMFDLKAIETFYVTI